MAGSSLLKRVITTCGYCLERQLMSPDMLHKSPRTAHRIYKQEYDREIRMMVQTIECTRCGSKSEWVVAWKRSKAKALELRKAMDAKKTSPKRK